MKAPILFYLLEPGPILQVVVGQGADGHGSGVGPDPENAFVYVCVYIYVVFYITYSTY